jgi:hypothetical protein
MTLLTRIGRLFPRNAQVEAVRTTVSFAVAPEVVWRGMLFYEEVPGRPPWLLRFFLPAPVRTEGEKTRVGSVIKCTYEAGYLEKCITSAEPEKSVGFDVTVQQLGVEDCISMNGGSYEMRATPAGTEVVLTTNYRGHLRPRWLARPLEHFLAHGLHRHILEGMRAVLETPARTPSGPIVSLPS